VLKKGKTIDKFHFALGSTQIPSITGKPVKNLGTVLDCSLRDPASNQELEAWLPSQGYQASSRSGYTNILPRILWPLLVSEGPVAGCERRVSVWDYLGA